MFENNKKINSGYLLSTRDLCSLDFIPSFIKVGVKSLKIEGRMKSAEYVAIVTRIYKKYIDLALSNEPYIVDENDRKILMQVFNRGMSSTGHLDNEPNRNLICKEKPNNMGLLLGKVQNYNKNKGYITLKLKEHIQIGDTISLENEPGTYTVSELMQDGKNITDTKIGQTVTIGRMKGNIDFNNKIYKINSKKLSLFAKQSYQNENRKIPLNCEITVKKGVPISIDVTPSSPIKLYRHLNIHFELNEFPVDAKNKPLDEETVIRQISKTANTPYQFKKITVNLDNNVFVPKLSVFNELRRKALEQVENFAIERCFRDYSEKPLEKALQNQKDKILSNMRKQIVSINKNTRISLLLNCLNLDFDYSELTSEINNIYIPLRFFLTKKYEHILKVLSENFNLYIYMPTIIKGNYKNLFYANAEKSVKKYDIRGFVISNICNIRLLNELFSDLDKYFKIVANYTFNAFNLYTVLELKKLGASRFTISPELDRNTINALCDYNYLQKELIVYGKTPLVNMNYCLLR